MCFARNQTVAMEHDPLPPWHLVATPTPNIPPPQPPPTPPTRHREWHVRAFAGMADCGGRRLQDGPETTQRPRPWHSFPGLSGSSGIGPFRFLRKREVQAHICTHRDSTQLKYLKPVVLQMAGVSTYKRKWKPCRRGNKKQRNC